MKEIFDLIMDIGSFTDLERPINHICDRLDDITDAIKTQPDRAVAVDCRLHLERSDLRAILAVVLIANINHYPEGTIIQESLEIADRFIEFSEKFFTKNTNSIQHSEIPF